MPLSIFSFKRPVPEKPWPRILGTALLLALSFFIGWEIHCRGQGYRPTYNDTTALWASRREAAKNSGPGQTVIVGASRVLAGIDPDVYVEGMGGPRPIFLALNGSTATPVLADLAKDVSFSGTVICSVVPAVFFALEGLGVKKSNDFLNYYSKWSPSQRIGHYLGMRLEERLAFIQQEDLTLKALLGRLPILNRPDARLLPEFPGYLFDVKADRREVLIDKLENDPAYQAKVKKIWLRLFGVMPPLEEEKMDIILDSLKEDVERIIKRGGKVVFLRLPSTGELRELEKKKNPREKYWDKLIIRTGAPGIHFEDYPELSGYYCPEWSHLNAREAARFTKNLIPILKETLK